MAEHVATQDFVPISGIRDGIVTLKNGDRRAVLVTSSINLSLKSADEQSAILMQFQNFLNSLEFQTQINIQSRRLNIAPYIELLKGREKVVKEDLLKIQIKEYIEFISRFTEESNIMTKHFFIIIPYFKTVSLSSGKNDLFPFSEKEKGAAAASSSFEQAKSQLDQRVAIISQGLARMGVRAIPLNTDELVELYYTSLNPGEENAPSTSNTSQ